MYRNITKITMEKKNKVLLIKTAIIKTLNFYVVIVSNRSWIKQYKVVKQSSGKCSISGKSNNRNNTMSD